MASLATGLLNLMLSFHEGWGWQQFFGLAVIGCFFAIPGVFAWMRTAERGWAAVFQAGPALLIPVVLLWTVLSHYTCRHEVECRDDLWRTLPFYGAIGAAALWHVALIASGKDRWHWPYAIIFLPLFYLFCMFGLVLAIKFPL